MAINPAALTKAQKEVYDFWKLTRGEETEELEQLIANLAKPKTRVRKEIHEDKEKVAREAEAVLLHLRRVDTLMQKECLECHSTFATNYAYAGRCSDDCIKASLHAVGIEWNPEKTAQERWNGPGVNGEIPAIVTPQTLEFLKNWARTILSWDEPRQGKYKVINPDAELIGGPIRLKSIEQTFQVGRYPRIEMPEGHLEEITMSAVEAEQQLMEENLREEYSMSGDVYGGTDLLNIDWDSI